MANPSVSSKPTPQGARPRTDSRLVITLLLAALLLVVSGIVGYLYVTSIPQPQAPRLRLALPHALGPLRPSAPARPSTYTR